MSNPKILENIVQNNKRYIFPWDDAFWAFIGPDRMRDATCARPEETKKENQQRKKPYTAANWIFAHTIHVDGSKLNLSAG